MPFFSIILTSYNRAELIDSAVNSVIEQTISDWELIVVDDGSIDETKDVIFNRFADIGNIHYYFIANRGPARAKNFGINKASGRYITFLDSDDEYSPIHLESRKKILDKSDLDFIYGTAQIQGSMYIPDKNNLNELIHLDNCIIGGTFFINKKILKEVGGFPAVDYGEDVELFEKIKRGGYKIKKVDIRTYIYNRKCENSISNSIKNLSSTSNDS